VDEADQLPLRDEPGLGADNGVEERQMRLRGTSLQVSERTPRRPVRRWIGRQLVALGSRLANEPTMRPVRAR